MKRVFFSIIGVLSIFTMFSCKEDVMPKPLAYLRLDYPIGEYELFSAYCPFEFDYNSMATVKMKKSCAIEIQYQSMKATVFLTYHPVKKDSLEFLLRDGQNLAFKHVIKADEITDVPFINRKDKVYGMFYEVGGNTATNTQFYLTDSTRHFVTGSVYFYSKPNFDSIMPASSYVRDDVQKLMETFKWKDK